MAKNIKVFHVEFAKAGSGLSGGEKCMVEIIRHFAGKGIENIVLTTDNGKALYQSLGLKESDTIKYITIQSAWTEKTFHIFISYLIRPFLFLTVKKQIVALIDPVEDILMCHSDFFPNSIPSYFLARHFHKKSFFWFHMLAPDIFKGYTGHFTNKFSFPNLRMIHYKLNQVLFHFISRKGFIITVNPYYQGLFKNRDTYTLKKFGGESIYTIKKYGGITTKENSGIEIKKEYDLIFMGRFHTQKGLPEIPKILKILKKSKKNIKLVIIGGGSPQLQKKLFAEIKREGLSANVHYAGFLNSDDKFEYFRKIRQYCRFDY